MPQIRIKIRIALFCLIGLMVLGFTAGIVSYRRGRIEPESMVCSSASEKDVTLNRIHHSADRDGARQWTLDAESAEYVKAENKTVFKTVSATFFLKDGQEVCLASQEGMLFTDTQDMEVSGDVVVRSGPYELKTNRLHYDHQNRSLFTDTPISISGDGMRLDGHSLSLCLSSHLAVVKGGVEATITGRPLQVVGR